MINARPALDAQTLYRLKVQGYKHIPEDIDESIDECCSDKHLEEEIERRNGYQ
jgi:hypothetical protein